MKIAICSQNARTITPHTGKCRNFIIVRHEENQQLVAEILSLDLDNTLQYWNKDQSHPLSDISVLIVKTIGSQLLDKLNSSNIQVYLSDDVIEPIVAVQYFLNNKLIRADIQSAQFIQQGRHLC